MIDLKDYICYNFLTYSGIDISTVSKEEQEKIIKGQQSAIKTIYYKKEKKVIFCYNVIISQLRQHSTFHLFHRVPSVASISS